MVFSLIQEEIESLLTAAGWSVEDPDDTAINTSQGVAVRNFPLARGYGKIDYLLYLEGKAAGLIEISAENKALMGIPIDSEKYSRGLPFTLRLFMRPLPFLYQSRGAASCFTNTFDPHPQPRPLIGFHRPETLRTWLEDGMVGETPRDMAAEHFPEHRRRGRSFQERLMINMPKLENDGLSSEQHKAVSNLEISLGKNHPRTLLEMSDGAKRTKVLFRFIERLLQFADARAVLVLTHSADSAQKLEAAMREDLYSTNSKTFSESFPLQNLEEQTRAPETRLCITDIKTLQAGLKSKKTSEKEKPRSIPLRYNPSFPIESFEVLILASCETSLIQHFQDTLSYFDATLIGFTEKASQETADFFEQNLVMRYKAVQSKPEQQSDGLHVISSDLLYENRSDKS